MTVIGEWPLSVLMSTYEPFIIYLVNTVQLRSYRASLVGTRHAARVDAPQFTGRRHNSCFVLMLHAFVEHFVKLSWTAEQRFYTQGAQTDHGLTTSLIPNSKCEKILQRTNSKKWFSHCSYYRGLAETWYEVCPVKREFLRAALPKAWLLENLKVTV